MFDDPGLRIVRRGIDARWKYQDLIGSRVDGFNPLTGHIFIGTNAHFDRWVPHRSKSARAFNPEDELVPEALFAVHDYLHVWTCRWIRHLRPELGFGTEPITRDNFEDMVFCHILSEAVATVGLDYWYLSVVDLNEIVPIGTLQRGLTVSYREDWRDEYRRFCPQLRVQHPAFLEQLTRFYCDGVFVGFDSADLAASPALQAWITHELRYGQLQRRYCREWFAYLADDPPGSGPQWTEAAIDYEVPWRKRLTRSLAERLWAKVKRNEMCPPPAPAAQSSSWTAPPHRAPDFRFINLNRAGLPPADLVKALPEDGFEFLLRQYAARFDFDAFPEEAIGVFSLIRTERDFAIGERLLRDMPRLPIDAEEPRDLFLYN